MRITILTPYYPPEMGAPPARLYETAVRLIGFGHSVTVIAALPNRPLGRIYDGYSGAFRRCADEDGIQVIRTWIKPSAESASFISRVVNDLSFTWSSCWGTSALLGRQDVLIVQNPPIFSVLSAAYLARKTGARIVMWCGDVWPEVLLQSGQLKPGLLAGLMHRLQQYGFHRASLLALTNPTIVQEIRGMYDCPPISVWSNGVDTRQFTPEMRSDSARAELGVKPDDLLVGYLGLHGRFQGLDAIVEAAGILRDQPQIRFIFVGEGVEKIRLMEKAGSQGLKNIQFFSPRPKAEMPRLVASCDINVISLLARMPGTMPSKFYEAIASGTIPLTADGCEAAPLVQKYFAGVLYEPGDAQSAADAIMTVSKMSPEKRQQIRNNARGLALRFDRDNQASFINKCLMALIRQEELPTVDW